MTAALESSDTHHSVKTPSKQAREPSPPDATEETNGGKEKPEVPAALGNDVSSSASTPSPVLHYKRNAQGRLRSIPGKRIPPEGSPTRKGKMDRDGAMNDSTQKSSMSLTQPNSASAYELYTTAEETAPSNVDITNVHGHTPNTYDENDTGHIILDLDHASEKDDDEAESQDASYAAPIAFSSQPLEPQTPAPQANPFKNKGSVLNPQTLFQATQSPTIGRHLASPTSSRPSPNGFAETPLPFQTPFQAVDSPLIHRQQIEETPIQHSSLFSKESPLPAAFNRTFDASVLPRARALPEPRRYNSMKASQERREPQDVESSDNSDLEAEQPNKRQAIKRKAEDLLSRVTVSLHNKQPTFREPPSSYASAVEVPSTSKRRRSLEDHYTAQCEGFDARDNQQNSYVADSQAQSSAPRHASAPQIESTQADDVVPDEANASTQSADSQPQILPDSCPGSNRNIPRNICISMQPTDSLPQNLPDSCHESNRNVPGDIGSTTPEPSLKPVFNSSLPSTQAMLDVAQVIDSSDELLKFPVPTTLPEVTPSEPHLQPDAASSLPSTQALPSRTQQIDQPLKEAYANHSTLATPTKEQSSGSEPLAIPETSPVPESSLRPMADIAPSFAADEEEELQETPPGFSPDPEYEAYQRIIKRCSTPKKIGPLRKKSKSRTSSQVKASEQLSTIKSSSELLEVDDAIDTLPTSSGHILPVTKEIPNPKSPKFPQQDVVMEESQSLFVSQEPPADVPEDMAGEGSPSTRGGPAKETKMNDEDSYFPDDTTMEGVVGTPVVEVKKRTTRGTKPAKKVEMAPPTPTGVSNTASSELSSVPSSAMRTPLSTPLMKDPTSSTRTSVTRSSSATIGRFAKKPQIAQPQRKPKRKAALDDNLESTRSSKRQSLARVSRSSSIDPLSLPSTFTGNRTARVRSTSGLFSKMVFAVSYDPEKDKDKEKIKKCIEEQGGRLLEPGFANMFTARQGDDEYELGLTPKNKGLRFAAVIADEFSRKVKYMEALALGLPCISGQWVLNCIAKETVIDWSPYLLCAGRVEYLNDAHISRNLASYPAATSNLSLIIEERVKVLAGKSILIITSRAESDAKGKTVDFLLQASGPSRCLQVSSLSEAKKRLQDEEAQGTSWDLIFSYGRPQDAEKQLFSTNTKRKRASMAHDSDNRPAPSKVRILVHEEVIQSFITGRLLED